jgi:hypothetical protein
MFFSNSDMFFSAWLNPSARVQLICAAWFLVDLRHPPDKLELLAKPDCSCLCKILLPCSPLQFITTRLAAGTNGSQTRITDFLSINLRETKYLLRTQRYGWDNTPSQSTQGQAVPLRVQGSVDGRALETQFHTIRRRKIK